MACKCHQLPRSARQGNGFSPVQVAPHHGPVEGEPQWGLIVGYGPYHWLIAKLTLEEADLLADRINGVMQGFVEERERKEKEEHE